MWGKRLEVFTFLIHFWNSISFLKYSIGVYSSEKWSHLCSFIPSSNNETYWSPTGAYWTILVSPWICAWLNFFVKFLKTLIFRHYRKINSRSKIIYFYLRSVWQGRFDCGLLRGWLTCSIFACRNNLAVKTRTIVSYSLVSNVVYNFCPTCKNVEK